MNLSITVVRFFRAPTTATESGLLGWVELTIGNAIVLDGVAVRLSRSGRTYLAFPARAGGSGQRWQILRPLHQSARDHIERVVLAAIEPELAAARSSAAVVALGQEGGST